MQLLEPELHRNLQVLFSPYLTAADDGYTGANLQRPDWQRMMALVEEGKIGTVITKDYCAIIGLNQKDLENQGILA